MAETAPKNPLAPTIVRPLSTIAREIRVDWWGQVSPAARPYLEALSHLDKMSDKYGVEDADDIIRLFLSNAHAWRGTTARRIKAELNQMLKDNR